MFFLYETMITQISRPENIYFTAVVMNQNIRNFAEIRFA